jgi:HEAT repeat protein
VNINARPEVAQQLGVRSVPWVRLGPFELEGLHSPSELKHWSERAGTAQGLAEYLAELFKTGQIRKAIRLIADDDARLDVLLLLLSDTDTELQVRLGIGALLEEFEGEPRLTRLIEGLGQLTAHENARIRSDACHFLALTHHPDALPWIRPLLLDPDAQVREIARDSLEHIAARN